VRIRAVLGSILGSITVLVVGWQAGAAAAHNAVTAAAGTSSSASTSTSTGTSTATPTATPSATATPTPTSSASSSTGATGTFVGSTIETRYGPMQVEIVVVNGKITDVKALQVTNQGGRSVEISNQAVPILRSEVLAAQSAKVSSVGGATYTSEGYLSSLQSALDKANL
jgi:uncharacterized protein with FMN-binding domain